MARSNYSIINLPTYSTHYNKIVALNVDNAFMSTFSNCKFFLIESGRCKHPALETSDFCLWHSEVHWDEEYYLLLEEIRFSAQGFNLVGLNLQSKELSSLDFTKAKLRLMQLNGCKFFESDFTKALLNEAYIGNCVFKDSVFSNSKWESVEINYGEFTGVDFCEVRFDNTIFNSSRLRNCKLSKTRFYRCVLESLDFGSSRWICDDSYDQNIFPKFHRTKMRNCLFSDSDLSFFQFEKCEFLSCQFLDVDMQRTNFQECMFVDSSFEGISNIEKAYFDECTFNSSSQRSLSMANPDLEFSN